MVRNYQKKTDRVRASPTKLQRGLKMISDGYSVRIAAKECGLNYGLLFRIHKKGKTNKDAENQDLLPVLQPPGAKPVFTPDQEESLATYCKDMAMIGYGLSTLMVRELAYETAVLNVIQVPAIWKTEKRGGIDWFHGFMKRHPELSIRTPEACSLARASAFNRHNVNTFYDKLEDCLKRHPRFADGSRVGNLDETSNSTVQNTRKIVSPKGVKQVHKIKTAERGVSVTTCCIVTAYGSIIPPVMLFPRKKFVSAMVLDAFPGTLGLANDNGYMTKSTFVSVLNHIIKHTATTKDNPFLLLVDNVETHLSVEALNVAKDNGITILTFPPHCTHRLQPLDVSLFGPFKTHYDGAINSWLLHNPGQSVTIYHIAGFVRTALLKAGTVEKIIAGFSRAGIIPFDRNKFTDNDFLMSTVTERPNPNSTIEVLAIIPVSEPAASSSSNSEALEEGSSATSPTASVTQADNSSSLSTAKKLKSRKTARKRKLTVTETPHLNNETEVPTLVPTAISGKKSKSKKTCERKLVPTVTETPDTTNEVEVPTAFPTSKPTSSSLSNVSKIIVPELSTTSVSSPSDSLLQAGSSGQSSFITPQQFKGLPKAKQTEPKSKLRRKGKCFIPTDTPEKREVEARQKERDDNTKKIEENKKKRAEKKKLAEERKVKKNKAKRVLDFSDESNVDDDLMSIPNAAVEKKNSVKEI